jgi:hypothetical protein
MKPYTKINIQKGNQSNPPKGFASSVEYMNGISLLYNQEMNDIENFILASKEYLKQKNQKATQISVTN